VAVERNVEVWVAESTFAVSVGNNAPTIKLALPDVSGTQNLSLSKYFKDDHGQLTYSLTVEDPNVVNATLVGSTLYVQNGLFRDGRSLVTVTASDGFANVSGALNATYSFAAVSFQFEIAYKYVAFAARPDNSGGSEAHTMLLALTKSDGTRLKYDGIEEYVLVYDEGTSNAAGGFQFTNIFEEVKPKPDGYTLDWGVGAFETRYVGDNARIKIDIMNVFGTLNPSTRFVVFYFKLKIPTTIIDGAVIGYDIVQSETRTTRSWQDVKVYGTNDDPSNVAVTSTTGPHLLGDTVDRVGWDELCDVTVVAGLLVKSYGNTVSSWKSLGATQSINQGALPAPAVPAFGGPNLVSVIPDVVVRTGGSKSFNVTSHFNATKTPASAFKYFVTTNNHALLTIQNADEDAGTFRLTAEAAKYGAVTITVKAVAVGRDVDQWIATTTFKFSVNSPENDPSMTKALDDVTGAKTFNLTDYFTDADVHDVLTYSLTVEDPNVVNATLVGSTLYVQNGLFRDGSSLVTVTVSYGFANVSGALNANYSFAAGSFQFTPVAPTTEATIGPMTAGN
jgi:hypothetical protein